MGFCVMALSQRAALARHAIQVRGLRVRMSLVAQHFGVVLVGDEEEDVGLGQCSPHPLTPSPKMREGGSFDNARVSKSLPDYAARGVVGWGRRS